MSIAKEFKVPYLEVERDAKSLTIMLDTDGSNPHHELAAAINDIAYLLQRRTGLWFFSISQKSVT